jgi:hypothetical protein
MIDESGFDGARYDDETVFWHPGYLLLSAKRTTGPGPARPPVKGR